MTNDRLISYLPNAVKIQYGDSYIVLRDDRRIEFGTVTSWGGYVFDLYSHIGEMWRDEIDYIMAHNNIVISLLDDGDAYCNVWVSYDE